MRSYFVILTKNFGFEVKADKESQAILQAWKKFESVKEGLNLEPDAAEVLEGKPADFVVDLRQLLDAMEGGEKS